MRIEITLFFIVVVFVFIGVFHTLFGTLAKIEFQNVVAQAIGISTSVLPNEFNSIAQKIGEQQRILESRELALLEREAALERSFGGGDSRALVLFVLGFVLLLLALILTNYYLDWRYRIRRF